MAKASPGYHAFNAGEWSPLMEGRFDLPKYNNALHSMVNFTAKIQGPAVRRGGTRFIAIAKDTADTIVVPFEFSVEQAYILEFGDMYVRFYRDKGQIQDASNPIEVATPYTAADLASLRFIQSADVLFLFHPRYPPAQLFRTSHVDWTLEDLALSDGPYLPTNVTATTLTPSAATGTGITITASAVDGINDDQGFLATDVGRLIRIREGTAWGFVIITVVTSPTEVDADVINTLTNTNAKVNWRLGLYSGTTGYPACGTFFEDRLTLAGVPEYPQRFDLSRTGDYENFAPSDVDGTIGASHALAFTLNSKQVHVIRWLLDDEKGLLIGTVGGEWVLRPAAVNEALSATNLPQARQATNWGSADIEPLKAGNALVFVQRAKRKLLESAYFFEDDGFRSGDLTELAEHITASGIRAFAYQKEPDTAIWACTTDGRLISMNYRREQSVYAWANHVLGGTNPRVRSVAVIPSSDGSRDELWLVVTRFIDGQDRRYIEVMEAPLGDEESLEDAFYVDSGLTYSGAATMVMSNFNHLEGETVQLLVNGAAHPDRVVSGGSVTLERTATKVQGGLAFDQVSEVQTMRVEAGAADGTAQGKTKRITKVVARFVRSRGVKIGPDAANLDVIPETNYRDPDTPMGTASPLFTGDTEPIPFPSGYEQEGRILIKPVGPFPVSLTGLYPQVNTSDR